MNRETMLKDLAEWIKGLKESAKNDETFDISWFNGTKDKPFSIIAGWEGGFAEYFSDIMCGSKSAPYYALCIKVAVNEGPYAYTDFELMNMPTDKEGNIDDTCVALEWEDDPEEGAQFFLSQWERIIEEHGETV
jgi:hypothetical protein